MSDAGPVQPDARGAPLRPAGGARGERQRQGRRLRRGRPRTGSRSGASRPSGSAGPSRSTEVLDWSNPPFAKWFVGGKLNASYNCVDRHVEAGNGDRVAFHWVGEPEGDTRDITYAELKDEVCQAANALTELGVEAGDRVAIYMPMIPETVVAMLACARIGAPHTVVFGGFSSQALVDRIQDCDARVVITADGGYRRGRPPALKPAVDEALEKCPDVAQRARRQAHRPGRRLDRGPRPVVGRRRRPAEHRAHARGVRRRAPALRHVHLRHDRQAQGHPAHHRRLPRRHVVHALVGLRPQADDDVFWTAADIGWVTGHSYIVYGPLANGATSVMYEGTPDTPHKGRWWDIVEKYSVTILYCAPDRDPDVHEVGRGDPGEGRPVLAAAARLGG